MKISLNSTTLSVPNFKALKIGARYQFNPEQEKIAENIAKELRTPKTKLDNMTAEDFYKRKYDLDFLMLPAYTNDNSVDLLGTYFYRNRAGEWCWQDSSNFSIGKYNIANTEEGNNKILEDVQKANEDSAKKALNQKALGYLALAICYFGAFFLIARTEQTPPKSKTMIETVDTLTKKADTIKPDTANFLKHIGK